MKARAALLLALLAIAAAATAAAPAVHVGLRQTVVLDDAGGTVAWAVDPVIVEASIRYGRVTLVGRAAGRTVVSVATAAGIRNYEVVVDPPPARTATAASGSSQKWTSVQSGYDSNTARATTTLDVVDQSAGKLRRVHVSGVAQTRPGTSSEAPVSLPSVSVEVSSRDSALVLFDSLVEHSPLTVDGTSVRGVHVRSGPLRLHAGVASSLLYDELILPARAEAVAGLGLGLSRGRWSLTPSVFYFPSASETGGRRGVVGSLQLGVGRDSDALRLMTEIGYGGRWGGAADLAVDAGTTRLRLSGRHQPLEFASLGLGRARGTFAEGALATTAGRLTVNASGSLSRYALPLLTQRSDAATANLRLRIAGHWFLTGGASLGGFDGAAGRVTALSVPAGLGYEGQRLGVSGLYRYQRNTATNLGGSGGRFALRASTSRLRASAFVDGQRDVPTVDFVLRQEPRLARLLAELGLTAQSPEDIARILAQHAPLQELGYLDGLTLSLNPWRVQGGGDLAWSLQKDGRQQLRVHFLFDRTRTVSGERDTLLATAAYSRFIAGAEVTAGYTWTSSDTDGWIDQGSSFQVSIRKRFGGLPRMPWSGSDSISGVVFGDEEAAGSYANGMPPVAGARVRLDGVRVAETDARGRFRFDGVGDGAHTVEAVLPAAEGAFFTTASTVVATRGATAAFGVGLSPARLTGCVCDDAGHGVAGVSVRLRGGGRDVVAVSDSSGRYSFATAEGDYAAAVDPESLPAGYDASALASAPVSLRRSAPVRRDYLVSAHRAIAGRVLGSSPGPVAVRLVELNRSVNASPDGTYVFRHLKPGRYTVTVAIGRRIIKRRVEVPSGPALIGNVDLDPARPVS